MRHRPWHIGCGGGALVAGTTRVADGDVASVRDDAALFAALAAVRHEGAPA